MASPTSFSLPYICAVSMCRYPISSAADTASTVSAGATLNTPKPTCGICTPLFSVTFGTAVAVLISPPSLPPVPGTGRP